MPPMGAAVFGTKAKTTKNVKDPELRAGKDLYFIITNSGYW